jgi:HlyD family secretion protein
MTEHDAEDTGRKSGTGTVTRRREAPPWVRRALLAVLGLAAVAALVLALTPQPVAVDLATVSRGVVEVAVEEDGRTRVQDRHLVTAPVAATLRRIELDPGDRVEPGDPLAYLSGPESALADPRSREQLRARLAAAEAGVERARALVEVADAGLVEARDHLRRQELLLEGGSGSRSAVERAEAGLRAREAERRSALFGVEAAQGEVADLRLALGAGSGGGDGGTLVLRAPVAGTVLRVHRESEGAVAPGEPLLEVGDASALEVVVDLLSADAVRVEAGDPATLSNWGGEAELPARVRRVEPAGFTQVSALGIEEQRVNVVLEPTGEGWPALGDGYRVEARIVVDRVDDVPWVPAGALFRQGDAWAVFVVEGGRLRQRTVEVGRRSQARAEITAGLTEGDQVVIYPSDRVEDGVRFQQR